jgi:hypothetical protein
MYMSNIIRIKRRLPDSLLGTDLPLLSGGEIAFNEINSTLYYGASSASGISALEIGGSGAFATNTLVNTLTSDLQTQIDNIETDFDTKIDNLSSHVDTYFVEKIESDAVTLNGGLTVSNGITVDTITTSGNAIIGGDLTITANLSVLGTQTVVNTETINISGTSTQIDVVNNGTATGITVNQTGDQDVAEFKDDGATAFIIKGGSTNGGYVGIGTSTPNEKLTVVGNVSATGSLNFDNNLVYSDGSGSLNAENLTTTYNVTVGNVLDVTGASTFASTLSTQGAVEFDSTLNVDGAATLGSTLNVTGAATFVSTGEFNNTVTVTTDSGVTGVTLATNGDVTATGILNIDGVASLGSNLEVSGTTSLDNGTITTDGSGSITGTAGTSEIYNFILDGGTF